MKRPNPLIYFVFASLLKVYAFLKGQRVKKNTKIKAPCIILSNHTSFPDFIYTTAAAYPRRVNYLAADKMFYDPVLGFFLRLARAIPKHLYQKDPVATLNALRVIKKGGILGVFPESQISSIGVTLEFGPAIAKMVKKAGVTVYLIKHRNAYLVNPPWTKKTFKGKIETTIDLMFSHEQLVDQSVEEIYNEIIRQLAFNTHEYNEIKKKRFKLNDITNLQSVIFQCPNCHNKNLTSNKTSLICPDCGAVLTYDVYGKLGGHRLDILYRSQEDDIRNQIDNSEDFALESEVSLECYRGKRLIKVGEGKLRLEKTGYRFDGFIDGHPEKLDFLPETIPSLPTDLGINIQIYQNNQIYQFVFTDPRTPIKFIIAGEYIHKLSLRKESEQYTGTIKSKNAF